MKATAIRPYRCLCIECEPLPPIEGLHPLTHEPGRQQEASRKGRNLLGLIAERITPSRREE